MMTAPVVAAVVQEGETSVLEAETLSGNTPSATKVVELVLLAAAGMKKAKPTAETLSRIATLAMIAAEPALAARLKPGALVEMPGRTATSGMTAPEPAPAAMVRAGTSKGMPRRIAAAATTATG